MTTASILPDEERAAAVLPPPSATERVLVPQPLSAAHVAPPHLKPGLHFGVSAETYRALPYFNQSIIKKWMELGMDVHGSRNKRCPAKFKLWLDTRDQQPQSEAMLLGSLLDCVLLEPDAFDSRYVVVPEDAPKRPPKRIEDYKKPSIETITACAWWEEFETARAGRTVVTAGQRDRALAMAASLRERSDFRTILDSGTKAVIVAELCGQLCKCEIDVFVLAGRYHYDVKKCVDASNSAKGFVKSILDYRLDIQAAFYLDLGDAIGHPREGFCFLACEEEAPHFTNAIRLPADDVRIEHSRRQYRAALQTLARHIAGNHWPGYTKFEIPNWPEWAQFEAEMPG
jgi:exodeoxyribonuclease VIII